MMPGTEGEQCSSECFRQISSGRDFLQELIPPGASQRFFFDGEKIREIADGEEDNEQLAEAVRGLLGIELVGRLRTDLGLFIARHQREEDSGMAARLEAVIRDLSLLERRVAALAEENAESSAPA
jgi:DNA sulfur modification protein DndD